MTKGWGGIEREPFPGPHVQLHLRALGLDLWNLLVCLCPQTPRTTLREPQHSLKMDPGVFDLPF